MLVTAFCPCACCCGRWANLGPNRRLCAGRGPRIPEALARWGGFCAADPSAPFGTMVSIPGYAGGRPMPVLDRGGDIVGDRLDVFFPDHQAARAWGKRELTVRFYKDSRP